MENFISNFVFQNYNRNIAIIKYKIWGLLSQKYLQMSKIN